jgi:hypothetical protein
MKPMSTFDARATRMWPSFRNTPNFRPYDALKPTVVPFGDPGAPLNPIDAPMAALSEQMDFSRPDNVPEDTLSEAIWKSVKGGASPMPTPRHTLLVTPASAAIEPVRHAQAVVADEAGAVADPRERRAAARLRQVLHNP